MNETNENNERIRTLKCEVFDIDVGLAQLQAQANRLVEAKQTRLKEIESLYQAQKKAEVAPAEGTPSTE